MIRKYASVLWVVIIIFILWVASVGGETQNKFIDDNGSECLSLITKYVDAINHEDVDGYISLFTERIRCEMEDHVAYEGTKGYFKEEHVRLENVSKLSADVGKRSASVSEEELSAYEDIVVYYAELYMDIQDTEIDKRIMKTGYNYRVFVMAKEDAQWKLYRVSAPRLSMIVDAGEGFDTKEEQEALRVQEQL